MKIWTSTNLCLKKAQFAAHVFDHVRKHQEEEKLLEQE